MAYHYHRYVQPDLFFHMAPRQHPSIEPVINRHMTNRQFPPVTTQRFQYTAELFQYLLRDGKLFAQKVETSSSYAEAVKDAAQHSDEEQIKALVKEAGVRAIVTLSFTPDAIKITLRPVNEPEACALNMMLSW